ncbi:hypothetical protein LB521_27600 [Mesorhizobium sp. BR-1-1-8]|uniref:hypothetical protein n=1 Tax=Mesorhizobium sp. BR-1-1-8 TaxID=2876659 RepID=UPI001CCF54CE|nr:hypothetical protein [Mesorhizobium sp. BR-1-1-8]MBZ9984902.1 hypothetical protein [Mesorhizobium sp. BR-1-1-8]
MTTVGNIQFAPRDVIPRNLDSIARRFVEHDTTAQSSGSFRPRTADEFPHIRSLIANDNLRQVAPTAATERKDRGPYVLADTGRFYPFDPRPEDVRIQDIAHGLAMSSRYNGAGRRYYSTAEHSVLIANWIWWHASAVEALCGLLHDAPEPLSGFGDVLRPVKDRAPIIKETETDIWRRAIAPAFGLPLELPAIVHEADSRIIADEMAANMSDVDPSYRDPLGVELQFWTPDEAEENFLKTFVQLQNMTAPANDDHYPQHDREASAADRAYQMAKEDAV